LATHRHTSTNHASPTRRSSDLTLSSVTQGSHGSVTFLADGTVSYTPNADYNGADSFTYTVSNGGVAETATVNVTVNAVSDVTNGTLATTSDTLLRGNVLTGLNR